MDIIHKNTSVWLCPVNVLRNWSQKFVTLISGWQRMDREAQEEITRGNYDNALVLYDRLLADEGKENCDVLLGKAQTLILLDRFKDALDCYKSALAISDVTGSQIVPFIDGLVKKIPSGVPLQKPVDTTYEQVLCQICIGITVDPTTLPCGHTNCQSCIAKLAIKVCKVCNKPFCSYKVKVNVVLQEILKKHFPSELKASCMRLEGNVLLKDGKQEQALEKYLEAIQLNPKDHLLFSNISHVTTQLGRFQEGLEYGVKVVELCPDWPKGYYRKGCALIGLKKNTEASVAFLQYLSKDQTNMFMKKSTIEVIHKMFYRYSKMSGQDASENNNCELMDLIEMVENLKATESKKDLERESPGPIQPCEKKAKQDTNVQSCDVQDFECTLCCRLFYEPVTTPCGHVFCRNCLNRSLDHNQDCPICRSSLSQVLASRNQVVTIAIEKLMQIHLSEEYQDRKQKHIEEMEKLASVASNTADEIPIFVCTLAFPMMPCPLHIFEPRYRLMVRQCMESGSKQFGMCAYDDVKGFSEYGTMLEINDVQFLADGRSLVNTVGGRRFKVLSKGMQDGYSVAKVEWIADEPVPQEEEAEHKNFIREVYNEAKSWFNNLPLLIRRRIVNSASDMPSWQEDADTLPHGPEWLWWLIAICPLDPKIQAHMLGLKSLKERLESMKRVLTAIS